MQTLKTFLSAVLAKKYMNPSSDTINVLAGLDNVDTVFGDFVGSLDAIIRGGRSCESTTMGDRYQNECMLTEVCSRTTGKGRRGGTGCHLRCIPDESTHLLYTKGSISCHHKSWYPIQRASKES